MILFWKFLKSGYYLIFLIAMIFCLCAISCSRYQNISMLQSYSIELTSREKMELLSEHNKWRKQVGVADLKWSVELERVAQNWANKLSRQYGCKMMHSDNEFGENIFWANYNVNAKRVVDYWAAERFYYDYSTNSCRAGKSCGHYTQIVWRDTIEVGCAKARCSNSEEIWVCNYRPAGNIRNKRPY